MATATTTRKRRPAQNGTRARVLGFIRDFIDEYGWPPSYREIQQGCKLGSTCTVQHHLFMLERDGYIRRAPGKVRAIALVEDGE
jgi:repressor LexA